MYELNTFLFKNTHKNAIQTKWERTSKTSSVPWGMWTLSETLMPEMTPLTAPNGSSITSCTFAQLRNKVTIGYNGMPHIHSQNCHVLWDNCQPQLPFSSLDPADPSTQRHPDPISCFSTMHQTN